MENVSVIEKDSFNGSLKFVRVRVPLGVGGYVLIQMIAEKGIAIKKNILIVEPLNEMLIHTKDNLNKNGVSSGDISFITKMKFIRLIKEGICFNYDYILINESAIKLRTEKTILGGIGEKTKVISLSSNY